MFSRRVFLQSAGAALACGTLPVLAEEAKSPGINETLNIIAETLRKLKEVDEVTEHFVEGPAKGFVQWQWAHFRPELAEHHFAQTETVNANLLPAMEAAHALPHAGLDTLLHEGMVEGRIKDQLAEYARVQRELIRFRFTTVVPFGGVNDIPPSEDIVDRELNVRENLLKPLNQVVYPYGKARRVRLSPLARLGAGYILAGQKPVTLLSAEDPTLDAKAERAEQSGDAAEYQRWVMDERDKHFAKLVHESKARIVHLLVGYGHDLTDEVGALNKHHDARLSHLVVRVKGLRLE